MDQASYDEIPGRLHGLLVRLSNRLADRDQTLITEFIDAGELGLALEQMADALSEDEQPVAVNERADMLLLVGRMEMSDRVAEALRCCPDE